MQSCHLDFQDVAVMRFATLNYFLTKIILSVPLVIVLLLLMSRKNFVAQLSFQLSKKYKRRKENKSDFIMPFLCLAHLKVSMCGGINIYLCCR